MATDTIDDRRQALDAFANNPGNGNSNPTSLAPTMRPMTTSPERVFGAQAVAVYRDEAKILSKLKTLGAAAGSDWFYRFPVRNNRENRTDWIEGASIKLANDLARIYGNCAVDTRVFDLGDTWLIYANFRDFETGFEMTRPFQQRKSQKAMKTENDRQLDIAFQIGVSKAIRNVVVNALQTFSDYAFEEARNSLVDRIGKDLEKYRKGTVEGLARIPVDVARVEKVIGRAARDWLAPDVARVIAMGKAIADGMATLDETFPPLDAPADQSSDDETDDAGTETDAADGDTPEQSNSSQQTGNAAATTSPASGGNEAPTSAAGTPKSAAEWKPYARGWIERLVDATAGEAQWKAEKTLRNKLNVTPEDRDEVEAELKAKVSALRKGA